MARSLDEALDRLTEGATVLAGGTDLMVELNERRRTAPAHLVVVNRIPELRSWEHDPQAHTLRLGAAVTWAEIERRPIAGWVPSLSDAARTVGSPQIRNAGTIGGNVATSSPAGDGLPPLAALGAVIHVRSATGTRDVAFDDWMTGPKRTARAIDELVLGVTVPVVDGWQGYAKVGVRNAMVISTAGVAMVIDRRQATVRVALGSVGPTILRCHTAEETLAAGVDLRDPSARPERRLVDEFAALVAEAARPIDDHRSTADYRRHAVGVLARRLLERAMPSTGDGDHR